MISLDSLRGLFRSRFQSGRVVPLWRRGRRQRPERILMVALFDPRGLQTIIENIQLLGELSRFRFDLVNISGLPQGPVIPKSVALADYDGIYIHCTVSYNAAVLEDLDRELDPKIADFQGLKILMKQDEQYRTNRIVDYVARCGFDIVSTCVPAESVRQVYDEDRLPDLRFVHALTGYVSEAMTRLPFRRFSERPIDVGYRGSLQPFYFGRLAYEKRMIGEVVEAAARAKGLRTDISSRWEDRHMGVAWFDFLSRCKATLGVESGASVFDRDGEVEKRCTEYLAAHPDASFEQVHAEVLAPHDGVTFYNQISPRHFEAAACRTVQILYEGLYSGIFHPDRHYLSLRRDHANLDEVLERAMDPEVQRRLTEAAYTEIALNPEYRYDAFVERLDGVIEAGFDARQR